MKKGTILVNNQKVEYHIRKHKRAKRVNIRVYGPGSIRVTVPRWSPYRLGERFLYSHREWLAKSFYRIQKDHNGLGGLSRNDYLKNKERARSFLYKKLEQFNCYYGFTYHRLSVKDQRSRWGSCSSKGNLNFSYNLNYSKRAFESELKQTVSVSGNFSLTDKWKINFDSHYDITEDKLSATSISIERDLHCWSMNFRWVPVGYRKNYRFEISVNKAILKDLKYEKQKSWTDYL